jgi:hypothetical protein
MFGRVSNAILTSDFARQLQRKQDGDIEINFKVDGLDLGRDVYYALNVKYPPTSSCV